MWTVVDNVIMSRFKNFFEWFSGKKRMITEMGTIVAIEEGYLRVETIRQACDGCSTQAGCGYNMLNKMSRNRHNQLRVLLPKELPNDLAGKLAINDPVEIGFTKKSLIFGALMIYMFPLITMLVGAVLASQWWGGDIWSFMGAIFGFSVGIATVKYHAAVNCDNAAFQPILISN